MIARLVREPVLIIGVLVALFGVLTVFGLDLSEKQTGAVIVFAGAVMALIRYLVTPTVDVAAVKKPWDATTTAGPAAEQRRGALVAVLPAALAQRALGGDLVEKPTLPDPPDVTGDAGNVRG